MLQKGRRRLGGKHEKLLAHDRRIGLQIDSYDDLFSDFDPRPYHERELSQDFLAELNRFFLHKSPESLDLVLLVRGAKRSAKLENIVKKRLHIYFQHKYRSTEKALRGATLKSVIKIIIALCIMAITGYLAVHAAQVVWRNILKVMLEPASWFLFWTSLDELFETRRAVKNELKYFHRLSECKIMFLAV